MSKPIRKLLKPARAVPARATVGSAAPQALRSDEEHFGEDLASLHESQPGWDEPARRDNARMLFEAGLPVEQLQAIFGAATVACALAEAGEAADIEWLVTEAAVELDASAIEDLTLDLLAAQESEEESQAAQARLQEF